MNQIQSNRVFSVNMTFKDPLQNKLFSLFKGPLEQVLDFPRMNRLSIVDLTKTDPRMLERYPGRSNARRFPGYHQAVSRERHATCA